MAITRCPYCHAIIDEADKYCNNCGTQLLFNEDEGIEEEIPGEKILEAEVEEKDYTVDEPEAEKRAAPAKDLESDLDEELEEELLGEAGEDSGPPEDDVTEEVILVDEIEDSETRTAGRSRTLDEEGPAGLRKAGPDDVGPQGDQIEEGDEGEAAPADKPGIGEGTGEGAASPACKADADDETKEYGVVTPTPAAPPKKAPAAHPFGEGEAEIEYISETETPDAAATAGEAGLRPVTFDTSELEDLGRTVDLSREKVDKFLEVMAEKRPGTPPARSETPPAGPAPSTPEPPTGNLPPWASLMKGAPAFPEDSGPVETRKFRGGEPATPDTAEEVEIFPKRRSPDSTIGLPEKVSQAPLPFETTPGEPERVEEAEGEEGGDEEAEPVEEAPREEKARYLTPEEAVVPPGRVHHRRRDFLPRTPEPETPSPRSAEAVVEAPEPGPASPFRPAVFFKSKAFDVLFVGLFWLVALWLAASSMSMTLFDMLGSMSGPMLLLYVVLVLLYFFLFKFFLGETLGDRLFRPRE